MNSAAIPPATVTGTGRRPATPPRVGVFPPYGLPGPDLTAARAFLAQVSDAGLDHVCCGDHVSFFGGPGFDGLVQATALAMLHPDLPVHCGVYLLPLRHPVLVARQLADIGQLAPGRLVFGVGIGGEDRHEVAVCGIDPATRGLRTDECLSVLRQLQHGAPVSFRGRFFDLEDAVITPPSAVPVIVGGRSEAAVRRAGRLGDGWLGIWVSPRRFEAAAALAAREAASAGAPGWPGRHAMQVWCGLAGSRAAARSYLAPAMQAFYQLPFERFERYCPYGTPEEVAEFLLPYVAAGCTEFNLIPQAASPGQAVEGAAAVKRLLGAAS